MTTCLVGTPSIEGYYYDSCNRNVETISQTETSQETDRLLRIAHPLTPTSLTPTSLTPTSVQDTTPSPKYWTPTLTLTPFVGRISFEWELT